MKKILLKLAYRLSNLFFQRIHNILVSAHDMKLDEMYSNLMKNSLNPFNKFGAKYFSQNEEDGLVLEIIKRLKLESGVFLEFGVGDGLENNSIILLAKNWRGVWLSGQKIAFSDGDISSKNLIFKQCWITKDSIVPQANNALKELIQNNQNFNLSYDLISIDLDGIDIYVLKELLKAGFSPSIFILEYNPRFPASLAWSVDYSEDFVWDGSDYSGSSLAAFCDVLQPEGYFLVCCSITGTNSFFVKNEFRNLFSEVPSDIEKIYHGPRYYLFENHGHKVSPRTVKSFVKF